MGSLMKKQTERFLREKKRHRRWLAVFLCLALLVASGTFAALQMNGQAMDHGGEEKLDCKLNLHEHTEECFDAEGKLVCGYADYVVHSHDEVCYDGEGNLICELPEIEAHVHDSDCYTEEEVLICEEEESVGHQHSEQCYIEEKGDLICGLTEHEHSEICYDEEGNLLCGQELHSHEDVCFAASQVLNCTEEEGGGHIHTESCYEIKKTLICGKEEVELHTHDEAACYDENGNLICGKEELKEHEHGAECLADEKDVISDDSVSENSITDEIYVDGVLMENEDGERFWQFNGAFSTISVGVIAEAPEEAFAEGVAMRVTQETPDMDEIGALVEGSLTEACSFNISFLDADGIGIGPAEGMEVKTTICKEIVDVENTVLIHTGDEGSEVVESAEISESHVMFRSGSFSVYTIVTMEPEPEVLDENSRKVVFNGEEVLVTVKTKEGVLPEGARLAVTVPENDMLEALEAKLPDHVESYRGIVLALDISFVDENGEELQAVENVNENEIYESGADPDVSNYEVEIHSSLITDGWLSLVRSTDDGVDYMADYSENGYLSFAMDTFGLYVAAERDVSDIEGGEMVYGTNYLALDESFFNYWEDKIPLEEPDIDEDTRK